MVCWDTDAAAGAFGGEDEAGWVYLNREGEAGLLGTFWGVAWGAELHVVAARFLCFHL